MSFRSFDLLNLVRDFGETLTLRKVTTAGTYNPATGAIDNSATTDYNVTGYLYNYNAGALVSLLNLKNPVVLSNCSRLRVEAGFVIAASPVAPMFDRSVGLPVMLAYDRK